jgi:hypothetical protein
MANMPALSDMRIFFRPGPCLHALLLTKHRRRHKTELFQSDE